MIVGISHIGATVLNLESALQDFARLGFKTDFVERNLPNDPQKRQFMNRWHPTHHIAFIKGNVNSVGLELIEYPEAAVMNSDKLNDHIRLHFTGRINETDEVCDTTENSSTYQDIQLCCLRLRGRHSSNSVSLNIAEFHVKEQGSNTSRAFWQNGAGFKPVNADDVESAMEPGVPLLFWKMALKPKITTLDFNESILDEVGLNLITLVTSDIAKDRERLIKHGGRDASNVFVQMVNQKELKIALMRSPEGHVVELIEFPKQGRVS